jgi:protein-tyrosine phosphatase
MKEVFSNLWVGSDKDVPQANQKRYAIIHACKDGDYSHRAVLKYKERSAPTGSEYLFAKRPDNLYLNLIDTDDPGFVPREVIDAALVFIKENLDKNRPVLVHCNAGQSRAPTIAFLYLYSIGKLPAEHHKAIRTFRQLYPDYEPSIGLKLYALKRVSELKNRR